MLQIKSELLEKDRVYKKTERVEMSEKEKESEKRVLEGSCALCVYDKFCV